MNDSSKATSRPDSLTGVVAAFEGLRDACILLNGPSACRSYVAYLSGLLQTPTHGAATFSRVVDSFFSQRRVPCTCIDGQDFIYGTEEKVTKALTVLDANNYRLVGLVNHSGTSLIGDDLNRFVKTSKIKAPTVVIESSGFTGTYADGFKEATIKILNCITEKIPKKIPKSVNIVGPTLFHYNWENDVNEIKRTLNLLGINVISTICVGESVGNLKRASQAELNLVLYEEFGDTVATYLEKACQIPSIGLDLSAPFGLSASETWFMSVADFFGVSRNMVDSESKRVRMKCYPAIKKTANSLKGASFGLFGDSSQVMPLLSFLYEYLGLYPVVIGLKEVGPKCLHRLRTYVAANSLDTTILTQPDQYETVASLKERAPRFIFGTAAEAYLSRTLGPTVPAFIPVSYPYYNRVTLTPRPLIGFNGVLTIIEDILNSHGRFQHA
jgi:light-independent protochlorophyllide reductase B subunit